MEGEHNPETRNKITITNGFTKRGVRFKPPTSSSSWGGGDIQILKYIFFLDLSPHHSYRTWNICMEPPKDLVNIWGATGTIELDDFIYKFNNWCDM
jgi:hypothetical protein